jgi:hypothetical protein
MRDERSSFFPLWGELSDFHLAHRGRFLVTDRNKGHRRNTKQINNTSRLAIRTLAAGMMAGITSPARPWFRLATPNTKLMEDAAVKQWLMDVERLLREIFNQSNLYNQLQALYSELSVFGTSSMGVFEDFDNVVRFKTYTIGSYFLALNGKDEVETWAREYQITIEQCVDEFGFENCSQATQNQWKNGNLTAWITVLHLIEPNDKRDSQSPLAGDKKYRSTYIEMSESNRGKRDVNQKFLRRSGFDEFPILAPRWDIVGEDIYSNTCPGIDAIGDTKALQLSEEQKYRAIEKQVDPHLTAPTSLKNAVDSDLLPGDITFVSDTAANKLEPVYQVQPDLQWHNADIQNVEMRIDKAFYVDLFLMLANSDRRQITAREVAERHEEKLLMLGPVLERLHNELLDPLIDRVFSVAVRAGIVPPPPEALSETELKVEYISVLAQAQRLIAVGSIEQAAGFIGNLTEIWPEARHKFKVGKAIDDYTDALGVAPDIIASEAEFAEAVAIATQQAQAQQTAEAIPAAAKSVKDMSDADTSGKNALTDVIAGGGGNLAAVVGGQ